MRKLPLLIATALSLGFCGAASGATVPVPQLVGDFQATNTSVISTNDGVRFGLYANAGTAGGSLYYRGFNGHTLSEIASLSYTVRWDTSNNSPLASPYLRIFLDNDTHDVVFDPTQCATATPTENEDHTFTVTGGNVRYDDDACDGVPPDQQPWAAVVAAHGGEVISGIYVTQGFSGGTDASALLTHLELNGTDFCFSCRELAASGPVITPAPTVVINQAASSAAARSCRGDTMRKLHAPKRRGQRFLGVRATLRGKRLKVSGRRVTVNLTSQPEGNYNVRLTIRYRAHRGATVTLKTTRNLSVVCA